MFWQRALVGLTLGPLSIFLIYYGEWPYFLAISGLLLLGTTEYANFTHHLGWRTPLWLLIPAVSLFLVNGQWPSAQLLPLALTFACLSVIVFALWSYEKQKTTLATADLVATWGGILLIGWLGSHFLLLRQLPNGWQWAMLVIVTVWSADTFAYLVGRQIGKHKLVPRLSPKKSVEGYVGGIVFGVLTGGLLTYFFFPAVSLPFSLALSLVLSLTVPAGDLSISLFKREAGVKDSGHIFPGHGGILDRVDSLLWGVALAYYIIWYWLAYFPI